MAGLYYEEFAVGMEFRHAVTRTVTEMDNVMFCAMTHNPQPLHPVFHGDTIHVTTRIKEMRESKSRPDAGLIVFEHFGWNPRDQEVAYCVRTGLMRKRPS